MIKNLKLHFNDDILLHSRQDNNLIFQIAKHQFITFEANNTELAAVICLIANQGASENEIADIFAKVDNLNIKQRAQQFIRQLKKNNFINYELKFDVNNSVILCPNNSDLKIEKLSLISDCKYKLSMFTYIRMNEDNNYILNNPLAEFHLIIQGQLLIQTLISILDENTGIQKIIKNKPVFYQEYIKNFLSILVNGKFLEEEKYKEPNSLKMWEFHDLIFHLNSRLEKSADKYHFAATYRFQNKPDYFPPDYLKHNLIRKIELYKVKDEYKNNAHSLFEILAKRRSFRSHGKRLISLKEIGEFLYRTIAFQDNLETEPSNYGLKPYPSAGGIHELEFYVICNCSEDLKRGIYFYDSLDHTLGQISENELHVEQLIEIAKSAWGKPDASLQILIVITSKFQKMSWKYESIAYRNTLLNTGAVFQTMYLVATAMNLAPCALGYGNSKLFSSLVNLNHLEETSVGEFALGTLDQEISAMI